MNYIAYMFVKNASDFWSQNKKIWELLVEEGGRIFQNRMPLGNKWEF